MIEELESVLPCWKHAHCKPEDLDLDLRVWLTFPLCNPSCEAVTTGLRGMETARRKNQNKKQRTPDTVRWLPLGAHQHTQPPPHMCAHMHSYTH